MPFDHPDYLETLAAFYAVSTAALAAELDDGRDVALLAEGDPLFYGSFMHLYVRLRERFALRDRAGRRPAWRAAGRRPARR